jgi:hypothetical protein
MDINSWLILRYCKLCKLSEWVPRQYTLYRSSKFGWWHYREFFYLVCEHDKFIALFKKPPSARTSLRGAALGSMIKETSSVMGLQAQDKDIANL